MLDDTARIEQGLEETFARYQTRIAGLRPPPTLATMPNPTPEDIQPLSDALQSTTLFARAAGHWIWSKGTQNVVSVDWIADWLAPQYNFSQPARPLAERVVHILSTTDAKIRYCTAVWGAQVEKTIAIDRFAYVYPFGEFAATHRLEFADRAQTTNFLGPYRSAVTGEPTIVISIDSADFPFLSDDPRKQAECARKLALEGEIACLAMIVLGTRRPIIDVSWFEYDDDALNSVWREGRRYWRTPEVLPTKIDPVQVNLNGFSALLSKLRSTPPQWQEKLLLSIRRFELSLARREIGNQAIDLCTAFEQVLGSDGRSPISWTNGLRCAALIGGTPQDKRDKRDIIEKLYITRNAFVHGGRVGRELNLRIRGKVRVEEAMELARSIYSSAVEKLIEFGSEPDWFELETTGTLVPK